MAFIPDDAMRRKREISHSAWDVYEQLCAWGDRHIGIVKNCYVSNSRLVEFTGLKLGTIKNALTELRQKGWIEQKGREIFLHVGMFLNEIRELEKHQKRAGVKPLVSDVSTLANDEPPLVSDAPSFMGDGAYIGSRARSYQPINQPIEPAKAIGADAPPVAKILPYPTAKSETDHQRMMRELTQRTGAIPDGAAQGKAAKWLLEHGYMVEQCVECLEALLAESWRSHRISWLTVQKEIGTFLAKGRQHGLNARYGTSGGRDHAEIGRRQSTRPERTEQALSERDYDALFATN
jgi:hypothetical protein